MRGIHCDTPVVKVCEQDTVDGKGKNRKKREFGESEGRRTEDAEMGSAGAHGGVRR